MSTTATGSDEAGQKPYRSFIPYIMNHMPWSKFHWLVILGLGTAWILDGLEIQIVSAGGYENDLKMSAFQVGLTSQIYLVGQVTGALFFGRLTDKLGRKKLFTLTLAIYLLGSALCAFVPAGAVWLLWVFRFISGMGIGGEYSAINSAIDEMMPGRYRGRVDLAINGTYWLGAMFGSLATSQLLNTDLIAENLGWRIAFMIGPVLGLVIIYMRRHIPESPRWLVMHGREKEAEAIVAEIERHVTNEGKQVPQPTPDDGEWILPGNPLTLKQLGYVFFKLYGTRTLLGVVLMVTQSFLYNAIFFTYSLVLQNFYGLPKATASYYFFPFALGNLLGPVLLGHFFDTIGRRKMIGGCYVIAAAVLTVSAFLFSAGALSPLTHTIFWCVAFFFASAGASAGYLTVSEIFPLEVRGQAISYFFSIAQICGSFGPTFFGWLIGDGTTRAPMFWGYIIASVIMAIGGIVAFFFGVDAEGKSLEEVAPPLTSVDEDGTRHVNLPV